MWFDILKKEVTKKGPVQVAKELGVSRALIDMVIQGKYSASTENIKRRTENIYGNDGSIHCPVLNNISPDTCAYKWSLARKIGLKVGNPETLRLYKQCLKCPIRK
jgi:hypothetical protein